VKSDRRVQGGGKGGAGGYCNSCEMSSYGRS
jgi:hypothetical protein